MQAIQGSALFTKLNLLQEDIDDKNDVHTNWITQQLIGGSKFEYILHYGASAVVNIFLRAQFNFSQSCIDFSTQFRV